MGKKDKSSISDSGVLSLDSEEFDQGMVRKDYGKSGGMVPPGKYVVEVDSVEIGIRESGATKGCKEFIMIVKVAEGDHVGRSIYVRAIASGNTWGQIANMLEGVYIDPASVAKKNSATGRTEVTLPTEAEVAGWKGIRTQAVVTERKDLYEGKKQFNTVLDPLPEGSAAGGAKKAKKKGTIAK